MADPTEKPNYWDDMPTHKLLDYAEIHAGKMSGEGHHVTSRVLDALATRIEQLEGARLKPPMAKVSKWYPLAARVWFRKSTNQWVLEIEGEINGTHMVCRHPQPANLAPEDVPGLPARYESLWETVKRFFRK